MLRNVGRGGVTYLKTGRMKKWVLDYASHEAKATLKKNKKKLEIQVKGKVCSEIWGLRPSPCSFFVYFSHVSGTIVIHACQIEFKGALNI